MHLWQLGAPHTEIGVAAQAGSSEELHMWVQGQGRGRGRGGGRSGGMGRVRGKVSHACNTTTRDNAGTAIGGHPLAAIRMNVHPPGRCNIH